MRGKGKVVLLVVALLFLSLALSGFPTGTTAEKKQAPPKQADMSGPIEQPTSGFLKTKGLKKPVAQEWGYSLAKVGGTTLFVLVLAGGVIFALSKLQRGPGRGRIKKSLDLLETLRLGPRKRIHLAQIAHRTVVLAETDKDISLLLTLDDDDILLAEETPVPARVADPLPTPKSEIPFGRLLKKRAAEGGK